MRGFYRIRRTEVLVITTCVNTTAEESDAQAIPYVVVKHHPRTTSLEAHGHGTRSLQPKKKSRTSPRHMGAAGTIAESLLVPVPEIGLKPISYRKIGSVRAVSHRPLQDLSRNLDQVDHGRA